MTMRISTGYAWHHPRAGAASPASGAGSSQAAVAAPSRGRGGGQEEGEPAPPTNLTLDLDLAADLPRQSPRDGQPQSEALPAVALTVVHLDEIFEDPRWCSVRSLRRCP